MPIDRRMFRDVDSAYEGMFRYGYETGQYVLWFRFNKSATTSHPVYDTGPQRAWYPAVTIPVLVAEYQRAGQNFDDDALYLVDHVHGVMSYKAFFQAPIADPDTLGQNHVNDRVAVDGRLFSVTRFLPQGRVASSFLTISFDLTMVTQEDLDEDVAEPMFEPYRVAT